MIPMIILKLGSVSSVPRVGGGDPELANGSPAQTKCSPRRRG